MTKQKDLYKHSLRRMRINTLNVYVILQQILIQYRNTNYSAIEKFLAEIFVRLCTRLDLLLSLNNKRM